MDKLILLIGASGSGKTTISKELEKLGYNIIHSYTTRKPRVKNEWGHKFVKSFPKKTDNHIAYTFYDNEHYWATKEQYQGKGNTVYVIDRRGAIECMEKVTDAEVITVFLETSPTIRAERMVKERSPLDTISRLKHDKIAFKDVFADVILDGSKSVEELVEDVIQIFEGGIAYE